MRSSRVSRETAVLVGRAQLDSMPARRVTRSALARFAYEEPIPDIEDLAGSTTRKRRRVIKEEEEDGEAGPSTTRRAVKAEAKVKKEESKSRTESPTEIATAVKDELLPVKTEPDATTPARKRRLPARVIRGASPSVLPTVEPPTDWEEMYNLVRRMRLTGPAKDAAVDTMGCDRLFTPDATPRNKRFHILIALMLSSQTKDTVNAVAMNRLHTELPPHSPGAAPGLNVENVLAVDPTLLNTLIRQVGFHNNKTKYIKAAAIILRDNHNSDIPDTIAGLTALPGVGPKMAHLCLSAAWDRTEGIGVDVHVHRITNMWGWHKTSTPEATRVALESWLPRDKWREINQLLVGMGQTICPSQAGAKRCGECDLGLRGLCAGADRRKVNEGRIKAEGMEVDVKMEAEVHVEAAPGAVKAEVKTETEVEVTGGGRSETAAVRTKTESARVKAETSPGTPSIPARRIKVEDSSTTPGNVDRPTPIKAENSPEMAMRAAPHIKSESSPAVALARVASVKSETSPGLRTARHKSKVRIKSETFSDAAPSRSQRIKVEASPVEHARDNTRLAPTTPPKDELHEHITIKKEE